MMIGLLAIGLYMAETNALGKRRQGQFRSDQASAS